NAISAATAADIFSLLNLLGDSSIASTSQSASFPQDFNTLLTEMIGPTAGGQCPTDPKTPQIQVANVTQTPVPAAALVLRVASPSVRAAWQKTDIDPTAGAAAVGVNPPHGNPVQFSTPSPVNGSDRPIPSVAQPGEPPKPSSTGHPATSDKTADNVVVP